MQPERDVADLTRESQMISVVLHPPQATRPFGMRFSLLRRGTSGAPGF